MDQRELPHMKSIVTDTILTSIRSRSDGSLGLSFTTPELTGQQKLVFIELHQKNCKMLLTPQDEDEEPPLEVTSEIEQKSPSQRLRAVMFVWFKQLNLPGTFDQFYAGQVELVIDKIKAKLDT